MSSFRFECIEYCQHYKMKRVNLWMNIKADSYVRNKRNVNCLLSHEINLFQAISEFLMDINSFPFILANKQLKKNDENPMKKWTNALPRMWTALNAPLSTWMKVFFSLWQNWSVQSFQVSYIKINGRQQIILWLFFKLISPFF